MNLKGLTARVGDAIISPSDELELLGTKFDTRLRTSTYASSVAKAARAKAAVIRRLTSHIPSGRCLRLLGNGLLKGKVGYALAATASPRLQESETSSAAARNIQVSINDTARAIIGVKRKDRVEVPDLLDRAGMPSYNHMVVTTIAVEAWKAIKGGSDTTLRTLLLGGGHGREVNSNTTRTTRAKAAGLLHPPLPLAADTFVYNAYRLWNGAPSLRKATTLAAARRVAKDIASNAPL